jgi:predicted phosphoserine aminotransferase
MTTAPKPDHVKLFIPGPIEVRREVLDAQSKWMIGHRAPEFEALYTSVQTKLRQVFYTKSRVYVSTSSGTGLWEAASRNCVRDDKRILHLINGAFSERWAYVSQSNGKQTDTIEVEWGKSVKPEQLAEQLAKATYDAVAIVLNETSTGVKAPLDEMVSVIRQSNPDTLILVDAVSILGGYKIDFDGLGLDVLLTSTQKALALPPGLAFVAVSDRVLDRAKEVPYRGYYFDFIELEVFAKKNNTPSTPNVSLMYATDVQLDYMLAEGLEARFARHAHLAEMTRDWVAENGFVMFSEAGYHSPTVSNVANNRKIDISALNKFLKGRGLTLSDGYGKLKGQSFRIAHMGDFTPDDMKELFTAIGDFLNQ